MNSELGASILVAAALLLASGCGRVIGADAVRLDEPECGAADCLGDAGVPCGAQRDCNVLSDELHTCRRGICVALQNDRAGTDGPPGACNVVLGADNLRSSVPPYVFGALSRVPADDPQGAFPTTNYDFSIREFTRKGGLPIGGETRLPVAVVCDVVGATEASLDKTFDHLTRNLGVTSILTPLPAAELKRSFERVRFEQDGSVFFLSPFDSDPILSGIDDDGLLWHLLGDARDVAHVYPPLIRRVEDFVNPPAPDGSRPPIRLALLNTDPTAEADIASYIDRELLLNGRSATENGAEFYRRFPLKSGEQAAQSEADALAMLVEFQPHVIVAITAPTFVTNTMRPLELEWPQIAGGKAPPFWVMSHHQIGSPRLVDLATELPGMRNRVVGVNVAGAEDTRVYDAYLRELESEYPAREDLESTENFYDAAYFLLYASAAAADADVDGKSVADAMPRLTNGPSFDVGGVNIPAVLEHLALPGSSLSLNGALGPPNFDLATGTREGQGSVYCVGESDGVVSYRFDVLRLGEAGGELHGDFGCFPGF